MLLFASLLKPFVLAALLHNPAQVQPDKLHQFATVPTAAIADSAFLQLKTIVLVGRVETATGVLPGAIVEIKNMRGLRTVTDADGFFRLVVPATTKPVAVVASYAGYDDVTGNLLPSAMPAVLRLVVPHDNTELTRGGQQPPAYLRAAQKQIKQQLQQVYQ